MFKESLSQRSLARQTCILSTSWRIDILCTNLNVCVFCRTQNADIYPAVCRAAGFPLWSLWTMDVWLPLCRLSFKDFIQRFSDKRAQEQPTPSDSRRYDWVFSPPFSSAYPDSHWFLLLASFQKRSRSIITAAPRCQKLSQSNIFPPAETAACLKIFPRAKVKHSNCISDCVRRLLSARPCSVIDSNIVSINTFLAALFFLHS